MIHWPAVSFHAAACSAAGCSAATCSAAAAALQTLSPARPPSPYEALDEQDEDVEEEEQGLKPSPISEVMMECFAGSSGGALGVPAAAAPLLVMLRDDGACMVYKVGQQKMNGTVVTQSMTA